MKTIIGLFLTFSVTVAQSSADKQFEDLAKRYLDESPALGPVGATSLGDHRFDHLVNQVSSEARAERVAFNKKYIEELEIIPKGELSRAYQVDAALLDNRLRSGIWRIEELQEWSWNPLRYTGLAGGAIYSLMAREFAPVEERLINVAGRLEQFPRMYAQIRETIIPERVPKIHAETAVKQNKGVLSILDNLVVPQKNKLKKRHRKQLNKAIETARKENAKHQKWLEEEVLPKANGNFRIGPKLYDRKLAFTLQTPLTRQQILEKAESELVKTRSHMYDIAKSVYKGMHPYTEFPEVPTEVYQQAVIRAVLEEAYREIPDKDGIIDFARSSIRIAEDFVKEAEILTLPSDPVEIIIMPEFRRGVTLAYCDSPGPLETGLKTFYAVSPLPEEWTEKQVHSYLREYNQRSVHNLTIHEAMPGHFVQLAHSNRYPSTLRAVLSSGVFIEGWAVYVERVFLEEGFLDYDPLMQLIILKWYLRAIANAMIDQKIHAGDMSYDEAMELMIEDTFQEEREAAAKWIRAQLTSAQLSTYFVGFLEHYSLREEVQKRRGAKFVLKDYHDEELSFGSPPVQFVRALMLDELIPVIK
ncbi:MAG TPA: DUF885 domain-containing protein [Candidatus Marinimicrobia bacterium]|nr:DUF885 domain-containing protein [Candidatus Neomarinimicrobiota bacterium]HIB70612.1 DUF885 domain-containing protein [Candidatus Neomarinimicrobiota bacterium]HIN61733.1 DUF885 domain-containing protein [Candidatus Neomarinimicrobiota bacterium]